MFLVEYGELHLLPLCQNNLGKPATECQTILDFQEMWEVAVVTKLF